MSVMASKRNNSGQDTYYDLLLEIALGIFPGSSQYACKNWKILDIIAFD